MTLRFAVKNKHVKFIKKNPVIFGNFMNGYYGKGYADSDDEIVVVYTHGYCSYGDPMMIYSANDSWIKDVWYLCYGDCNVIIGRNHSQRWESAKGEMYDGAITKKDLENDGDMDDYKITEVPEC